MDIPDVLEAAHVPIDRIEAGMEWVRQSPSDHGRLELIVCRPSEEERRMLDEAELRSDEGLVGDSWRSRRSGSTPDGSANPDKQVTLMNARFASLIAVDPSRRPLAGDQLFVDLDLSVDNAPPGTRFRIGSALIEITAAPHLGCAKFRRRFGDDAMAAVNSPVGRQLRLRGANARVVAGGTVRTGDPVVKEADARRRSPDGPDDRH